MKKHLMLLILAAVFPALLTATSESAALESRLKDQLGVSSQSSEGKSLILIASSGVQLISYKLIVHGNAGVLEARRSIEGSPVSVVVVDIDLNDAGDLMKKWASVWDAPSETPDVSTALLYFVEAKESGRIMKFWRAGDSDAVVREWEIFMHKALRKGQKLKPSEPTWPAVDPTGSRR